LLAPFRGVLESVLGVKNLVPKDKVEAGQISGVCGSRWRRIVMHNFFFQKIVLMSAGDGC